MSAKLTGIRRQDSRASLEYMEEKYILTLGEGENQTKHLIERIIRLDDKYYFTIFNLSNGNVMFGEYVDELPEDEDLAREIVWRDFLEGCGHIEYPDGYIVDDLYEMVDFF